MTLRHRIIVALFVVQFLFVGVTGVAAAAQDQSTGGWVYDPMSGTYVDPTSGFYIDPTTNFIVDPVRSVQYNTVDSGWTYDAETDLFSNPTTGATYDYRTGWVTGTTDALNLYTGWYYDGVNNISFNLVSGFLYDATTGLYYDTLTGAVYNGLGEQLNVYGIVYDPNSQQYVVYDPSAQQTQTAPPADSGGTSIDALYAEVTAEAQTPMTTLHPIDQLYYDTVINPQTPQAPPPGYVTPTTIVDIFGSTVPMPDIGAGLMTPGDSFNAPAYALRSDPYYTYSDPNPADSTYD